MICGTLNNDSLKSLFKAYRLKGKGKGEDQKDQNIVINSSFDVLAFLYSNKHWKYTHSNMESKKYFYEKFNL